jgi:beta-fructofuranosidase
MKTDDGRRILLAWMDMWENNMPEQSDGWAGTMTIPRELKLVNNKLYSCPIQELKTLRSDLLLSKSEFIDKITFSIKEHQLEIDAKMNWDKASTLSLEMKDDRGSDIISVLFDVKDRKVFLHRTGPDADRQTVIDQSKNLSIRAYVDTSSFELFINNGEATFSERFYSEGDLHFQLRAQQSTWCDLNVYKLGNDSSKMII